MSGEDQVPFDEVITGQHESLRVTMEYHIWHCVFMWEKMHRVLLKGMNGGMKNGLLLLDSYVGNFSHTTHCAEMPTDGTGMDMINTIIMTKVPECCLTNVIS